MSTNATTAAAHTVLIVAGDTLRGDDGAPRAALAALRSRLSSDVTVIDSPSCLDAVPDILVARGVVVLDTALMGARPGDIRRLTISAADPLPLPGSLHDCGPLAALAVARQLGWSGAAALVGIEPLSLQGEGLSRPVSEAIPALADAVLKAVRQARDLLPTTSRPDQTGPHAKSRSGIGNPVRQSSEGCGHAHSGPATASPDHRADGALVAARDDVRAVGTEHR